MTDFSVRSDNVDIEQIMRQIRSRIREKRGVDYTEDEIRELANVKLEKFLDPRGVRSDLLEQFRRKREASLPPAYNFEDTTLYESHRGWLRFLRRLLRPILLMFFNPNVVTNALHMQSKLNATQAALEPLYYEVIHNLVLETTRLGIEVKNLKMRVESLTGRLEFNERRARALESVVVYKSPDEREGVAAPRPAHPEPAAPKPDTAGQPASTQPRESTEGPGQRSRRRRRRRGRRSGGLASTIMGGAQSAAPSSDTDAMGEAVNQDSTTDAIEQEMSGDSSSGPEDDGPDSGAE